MAVKFELPLTQNSTIVAFVCTLLVAVGFTLRLELGETSLMGSLLRLVHLGSFSTWLGVQVWVTFFAGITMYSHLPRHTFGFIQGKLFPKYFRLGTVLSSITLLTYIVQNPLPSLQWQQKIQGFSLVVSLVMSITSMLYFEPQTTACTMAKHKYEKEVSAGQAVGKVEQSKLEQLRKIPEYVVLEKRLFIFGIFHAICRLYRCPLLEHNTSYDMIIAA